MSVNKGRFELASYQSSPVFMEGKRDWRDAKLEISTD